MIQFSNVSKSFSNQELLKSVNFKLNSGNRVGLVGRNGSGKSTLFKLILNEESADSGDISIPKGYKIASLKQHLEFNFSTLQEEVASALDEESQYDLYKAEKILFGLGFTQSDLSKNPLSFSGGYQIRINLAKLLLSEPNLLLLDEPTNYLDILSLRWLRVFLNSFEGEVLLITHNRDFMDSVTTHTMGIVRRSLEIIKGNTHKFYAQLNANDQLYEKQKISQDKKRKELEEFIAKNKTRASTASLAQSKVKQLEKMEDMNNLVFDNMLSFDFNYKDTHAKVLLDIQNLSFAYDDQDLLFKDISFTLIKGQCLGIIGKNGKGKSTLLNNIAKELKPSSGDIIYHQSTVSAHFGQTNINHLNPKNTVMEEIYVGDPKLAESSVRSICGSMMFSGDSVKKLVSMLSGGEKSRVMLGQILAKNVNVLFLDEPTNHLDMDSVDALSKAIKNFKGGTIIVTHSEELLRLVANKLIVFSKNNAEYFDGTYDEFLDKIGWEEEEKTDKIKEKPQNNRVQNKKKRAKLIQERGKKTSPLKKSIDNLEAIIMELEENLEQHHQNLILASNQNDNGKIMEISTIVALVEKKIETNFEQLEDQYHQLDELINYYEDELKILNE
jgi:ATP-binding cassette subfamily F protein 3